MSEKQISTTHKLVLMAMMVAAQVALSRFLSISLWNLKIGFAFVPVVLTAMLLGPLAGGIVGAVAESSVRPFSPSGHISPVSLSLLFLWERVMDCSCIKNRMAKGFFLPFF